MTTIAPVQKSNFKPAPAGTQMARCFSFVHIGTNMDIYMGEDKAFNKIRLGFELPEETQVYKDGEPAKPAIVYQEYTLSMGSKANLRKLVEGMLGVALNDDEASSFDVETLVGMVCLVTIKHKTSQKGNVRAEISSATPLMKSQTELPQINPSIILSYGNWNQNVFEALPIFIKEKIQSSDEYRAMNGNTANESQDDTNDIPF